MNSVIGSPRPRTSRCFQNKFTSSRKLAEVIPRDVAIICLGAFFICCIFAFLPVYRAARLDPVTALRYE